MHASVIVIETKSELTICHKLDKIKVSSSPVSYGICYGIKAASDNRFRVVWETVQPSCLKRRRIRIEAR